MRALIPYDYGLDLLGELPDGVSVGVWDAHSEPPEGAAEATFWVPPWETLDELLGRDRQAAGAPGAAVDVGGIRPRAAPGAAAR